MADKRKLYELLPGSGAQTPAASVSAVEQTEHVASVQLKFSAYVPGPVELTNEYDPKNTLEHCPRGKGRNEFVLPGVDIEHDGSNTCERYTLVGGAKQV